VPPTQAVVADHRGPRPSRLRRVRYRCARPQCPGRHKVIEADHDPAAQEYPVRLDCAWCLMPMAVVVDDA